MGTGGIRRRESGTQKGGSEKGGKRNPGKGGKAEPAHKHYTQQFKSVCRIRVILNCRIRVMMYQFPRKYRTGVKKQVYIQIGTSINKAIFESSDQIKMDSLVTKISTRTPKTHMVCYAFLRAFPPKSPKICPPQFYWCVEKHKQVCFPRGKEKIESRGAVFRRSEEQMRFKSIAHNYLSYGMYFRDPQEQVQY